MYNRFVFVFQFKKSNIIITIYFLNYFDCISSLKIFLLSEILGLYKQYARLTDCVYLSLLCIFGIGP